MTKLTKPITRETRMKHDGVPVSVTIDPGENGEPLIIFRGKYRKWQFKVALCTVLELAATETCRLSDDEIQVMQHSKGTIKINPRIQPEQKRAICEAIDGDIEAEMMLRNPPLPVLDDTDGDGEGDHVDDK